MMFTTPMLMDLEDMRTEMLPGFREGTHCLKA